jgi:hypothetical protein
MCWEVLLRGNGWDDCWVYECGVPLKLSSIQSTRLRMRWLWGVWMLSSLEIILHSVNSSEDEMIVGCMNVELPWNYPPFS